MNSHQRRGGPGFYSRSDGVGDQSSADSSVRPTSPATLRQNAAFADFLRSDDPNVGSDHNSGGGSSGISGGQPVARPHPRRGMTSPRVAATDTRRVTSAAGQMPSMRSIPGAMGPEEPVVTEGVRPTADMPGVAMGTVYDAGSYSGGSSARNSASQASSSKYAPRLDAPGDGHHRTGSAMPPISQNETSVGIETSAAIGAGSVEHLPNAPYQELMQNFGREDPSIQRARNSMAAKPKQAERPYPEAGLPQEPTSQAIEPSVPASRLGRRILTQRPERQPDFVVGRLSNGHSKPIDCTNVECIACGATVEIPKSAVMMSCPNCAQVHPAAGCRIVQPGR